MLLSLLACDEAQIPTTPAEAQTQSQSFSSGATASSSSENSIPLPIDQTFSGGLAFGITQTGHGRAGKFRIQNRNSISSALDALTTAQAPALRVSTDGTAQAGLFVNTNGENSAPVVEARSEGKGSAGRFVSEDPTTNHSTITAFKRGGRGWAMDASFTGANPNSSGGAGRFIVTTSSFGRAVEASNSGGGPAGVFEIERGHNSSSAIEASTIGRAGRESSPELARV